MQKEFTLKLKPAEAVTESIIKKHIASAAGILENAVSGYTRLHQSVDARSRQQIWVNLKVNAFINEPFFKRALLRLFFFEFNYTIFSFCCFYSFLILSRKSKWSLNKFLIFTDIYTLLTKCN